jgi:hypothetical protein
MVIDTRGRLTAEPSEKHETLASLKVSVEERANLVLSDIFKSAQKISMLVILALPCSRTRVLRKIPCPDLGALCQSLVRLKTPCLWTSSRESGRCKQSNIEISYYVSFSQCMSAPWSGTSYFFSVEAGPSALLTAGVMPSLLVPDWFPALGRLQTISIFFLVSSPLIRCLPRPECAWCVSTWNNDCFYLFLLEFAIAISIAPITMIE